MMSIPPRAPPTDRPAALPHVLIASHSFVRWPGDSTAIFLLRAFRELVPAGWRTTVVAPHAAGLARRACIDGMEVRRFAYVWPTARQAVAYELLPNLRRSWAGRLQLPFFFLAFVAAIVRHGRAADVIHAQWVVAGLCALVARPLIRRPIVLTLRGTDVALAERSAIYRAVFRFVLRHVDATTAVSERLAERAGAHAGMTGIHFVPNGVDTPPEARRSAIEMRRALALPEGARAALFVGNLTPVKSLPTLLAALAVPDLAEMHLLLVGEGELQHALEAQAERLGCRARVRFAGPVASEDIDDWYRAADLLVLPSLSEGRPNVVLEAMSHGLPVVATDVGGIPELVAHGETGLLVPPEDVKALAGALAAMLADPAAARRMGAAGRDRLDQMGLSWRATAAQYIAIYRNLMR